MPPYPDKPLFMDGHWWHVDWPLVGDMSRWLGSKQERHAQAYSNVSSKIMERKKYTIPTNETQDK